MNKIYYLFTIILFSISTALAAGTNITTINGDSVMTPNTIPTRSPLQYQGASVNSGNIYSYTTSIEYQIGICPVGLLTSLGSNLYNSAKRITTNTYLGSQLVGTNVGSWTDLDIDCIGFEYKTIPCPTGYNGTISQQRKVGTGVGGLVYESWTTTTNSCVAIPVEVCDPINIADTNGSIAIGGAPYAGKFAGYVWDLNIIWRGTVVLNEGIYATYDDMLAGAIANGYRLYSISAPSDWFYLFSAGVCKLN